MAAARSTIGAVEPRRPAATRGPAKGQLATDYLRRGREVFGYQAGCRLRSVRPKPPFNAGRNQVVGAGCRGHCRFRGARSDATVIRALPLLREFVHARPQAHLRAESRRPRREWKVRRRRPGRSTRQPCLRHRGPFASSVSGAAVHGGEGAATPSRAWAHEAGADMQLRPCDGVRFQRWPACRRTAWLLRRSESRGGRGPSSCRLWRTAPCRHRPCRRRRRRASPSSCCR